MQPQPIVLGTAGHIDHGKTALVHALTGIDTDRLKVEKERGITTELGFAHLDLAGRRVSVIDVPGHERFVKAMVAGAGGLDLVCLVIAADEGIMPQTREHLDICELLGVRRGVVALTKSDLVDDDWLTLVTQEITTGLHKSFLAGARIIPVSARTGHGLDALRAELAALTDALPARSASGALRIPLDRVFTIRGFGTVVTGTILSGVIHAGDAVVFHPRGITTKVRGLEVHGESVAEARAGMRCAVNLSGVARDDLARGDVLSHPGAITPSHILDTRFRYLPTSRAPLGRRTRVLLHHGTAQLHATLILVDPRGPRQAPSNEPPAELTRGRTPTASSMLMPGEEALIQLRLDANTPVAALPGDRFIVRGFVMQEHYGTTLGGGEILRVQAPKSRPSSVESADNLRRIAAASGDDRIALEVAGASVAAIKLAELGRRLGTSHDQISAGLSRLIETGEIVQAPAGMAPDDENALFVHAESFARLEKQALEHLDTFHRAQPNKTGMSREELRARLPNALPPRIFEEILAALVRRGAILIDRDVVARNRPSSRSTAAAHSPLDQKIAAAFASWGIAAPRPKEVAAAIAEPPGPTSAALERLLTRQVLVKVKPDYYIDKTALVKLRTRLLSHLDQHGQITPTEWKTLTGASRKYSIPLAEFFDAEKVTLRVGEVRKKRG